MGRRGPAPTPTNLRVLHGETRPSRINAAEPRPRDRPPDRPGWLTPAAAEEWDRIAPDLAAMGTVKAVDATGLAAYCEAVARFRAASAAVAASGAMLTDRDGAERKNPAVGLARDASVEIRMWAREFGLTPSARQPLRLDVAHHGLPAERLLS
jgi:P27 family predicted phage terminase small subunit